MFSSSSCPYSYALLSLVAAMAVSHNQSSSSYGANPSSVEGSFLVTAQEKLCNSVEIRQGPLGMCSWSSIS
ncbi:hypothetical protein Nepgr_020531 [Nepenthes gracilis]|uniref:Secreted protein n=1 Tax=Nepenthes gracilis TaxID=150966 RepID=A0AAD3XWC9_NEPGR|nr:hypothetical protein Nepgr_020531 [Nepenthes gracilis]